MINDICTEIYYCGKNSLEIKNINIRGYKRYVDVFYYAGKINVENYKLFLSLVLLVIDLDEFSHLEHFEERFKTVINSITNKQEFTVFRKVINDLYSENITLIGKMKNILISHMKKEILNREI